MNTNPLSYSDLIKPDNSITNLIAQLDELIATFETARQKIQGAATDVAKGMQGVSGASEEQRKSIQAAANESERLLQEYRQISDEERKARQTRIDLTAAQKEALQIDKLIAQINRSKEGSYNRLSAQYRLNKIRLNEMSEAERHGTKAGRELEKETEQLYNEMKKLQEQTGKHQLNVGNYKSAVSGLAAGFVALGAGIGAAAMALNKLSGRLKVISGFEQATVNLRTILGVTSEAMQDLENDARNLGRTTEYTAAQVVQLQTELAKLGFTIPDIRNMQQSVLALATDLSAGLGESAQLVGSTLRQFGADTRDAAHYVDVLVKGANASALSFSSYQTAMAQIAPVANAFGFSLEDTISLLGTLANSGLEASMAATATRNIILRLADANSDLGKSMSQPVRDIPTLVSGLKELRDRGVDLSEALEMTDRRSVAAFSALMKQSEAVQELRDQLDGLDGYAIGIRETRLQTIEGQMKAVQSAWEGVTLAFSNSRGVIAGVLSEVAAGLNSITDRLDPAGKEARQMAALIKNFEVIFADGDIERTYETTRKAIDKNIKSVQSSLAENNRLGGRWKKGNKELEKQLENLLKDQEALEGAYLNAQRNAQYEAEKAAKQAEEEQRKELQANRAAQEQIRKEIQATTEMRVKTRQQEVALMPEGFAKERELLKVNYESQRQQLMAKLQGDKELTKSQRAELNKQLLLLDKKYEQDGEKLEQKIRQSELKAEAESIQLRLAAVEKGSQEELDLRMELLDKQREIELAANETLAEDVRKSEAEINAKYDAQVLQQTAQFAQKRAEILFQAQQEREAAEFSLLDRNERQKTAFALQQEIDRLNNILELDKVAAVKMTDEQAEAIRAAIAAIEKERASLPYDNLYELLGINLTGQQQNALNTAIGSIKESISSIVDSWNEAAQAAVDAADKQVEAAKQALDAQIEARRNGYANNVAMAQKELELAQKNQAKAVAEKQKAERAQRAIDTITQASSLVTASANIWSSLSAIPVVGPSMAVAAIATMWASFAAAKVKAAQVSKTEKYGEGTVELLEGGSHASGHDIDLGRKKDGTRRRAEGGEYFAIINKRSSRKFRRTIPDVIKSLNDGTFADRYQRASARMDNYVIQMPDGGRTDLKLLESDVAAIRKQGEETRFIDKDGSVVVRYKNLTRKIR